MLIDGAIKWLAPLISGDVGAAKTAMDLRMNGADHTAARMKGAL
ncbi:hypothetical protein AB0M29_43390 [Streptomyces sp. NPDC051976]